MTKPQMKKKVGLDLDGVVYNFIKEFDEFAKKQGYKINKKDYNRGIPYSDLKEMLLDFSESRPFLWIPRYKKAKKQIERLSKKMDFYIITHRNWADYGVEDTLERISQDQIPFKEIYFTKNKGNLSKKLGLNYFIEDNFNNARDISRESDAVVFLLDKPYNQFNQKKKEKIVRIKSLKDII